MDKPPAKKLWPHQCRAFDALTRTLRYQPRATAVSPSASGKTLIAQRCADHLAPKGCVLVLVPYLELISQTADAWRETGRAGQFLGVCGYRDRSSPLLGHMPMTTKAPVLADQLASARGPVTVFATYQSLHVIIEAHRDHRLPRWDLVIADEAHHTAGALTKDWAAIHDDTKVPARRRIYLTATPRTGDKVEKPPDPEAPTAPLASMNDIDIFGPTVFTLTLNHAIAEGILADFRLVFPEIGDDELRTALTTHPDTTPEYNGPRVAAAQIALLRTMARYDLHRVLCFFNRKATARKFAETLPATAAVLPEIDTDNLWARAVYSGQSAGERAVLLAHFKRNAADQPAERCVLTNVRVISEGVDLPGIDGLAFIEPKYSTLEIVQDVGRGLRQAPGSGKIVTIVMPVYLAPGKSAEESVQDSDFYLLWQILTGLRTYGQHAISGGSTRHKGDPEAPMPPAPGPERAEEIAPLLQLRALEPDLGTWMCGMSSAVRYLDTHGDLDVPADYIDPERFPLGRWLAYQCDLKAAGNLAPARLTAMHKLGVIWRHAGDSTEQMLDVARAYFARNGHLNPAPEETLEGSPVGKWLCTERTRNRHGGEPTAVSCALSEITPHWNPPWPIEWQRMYALAHAAARADRLDIPLEHPDSDSDTATRWIDHQVDRFPDLGEGQQQLLADLPLTHPLALLLQQPCHRWGKAFRRGLRAARHYRQQHGHLCVPAPHIEEFRGERVHLGAWITRLSTRLPSLTQEEINAIEYLGVEWDPALRRTAGRKQSQSPNGWSLQTSRLNWPLNQV